MKNMDDFKIRSYGRMELAILYSPYISPLAAYKKLSRWIDRYPGLRKRLERTGLTKRTRQYTPNQVKMIVDALGEP